MIEYRKLRMEELTTDLFAHFRRRQVVTDCLRRERGAWVVRSDPFVDDWSAEDYAFLVQCLQKTLSGGGAVYAAFQSGALKGFASVEGAALGSRGQYRDLTSLHVSEELRHQGVGRALFRWAKDFARGQGAQALYISAHSAVESQAFYRAMGCVDAREVMPAHVRAEPFDRQLECPLQAGVLGDADLR